MTIHELYQQAKQDYDIALEQFNNAEQEYSEVATYRIKASKAYLDILIKEIKQLEVAHE